MMMLCSIRWKDLYQIQMAGVGRTEMQCMSCHHVTTCDIRNLAYRTKFYAASTHQMLPLQLSVRCVELV